MANIKTLIFSWKDPDGYYNSWLDFVRDWGLDTAQRDKLEAALADAHVLQEYLCIEVSIDLDTSQVVNVRVIEDPLLTLARKERQAKE